METHYQSRILDFSLPLLADSHSRPALDGGLEPEDAEKKRTFKFPFIACEIFTCEVDIILKTLVEDEELMDLLFSFLDPKPSHSNLLAGYFSKSMSLMLCEAGGGLAQ
ncbi:hypothetical protein K1719_041213 [Acacia pycnantha]|nr:hypothetical protein K1719_041213 [Acacia pycnantha]